MENSYGNVKQQQVQTITLTLDQHRATELLAIGKTQEEVAQAVEVDIATVEQWRRKPEFAAALNMLRAASLDSSATEEIGKSEPITTLVDVSRF